MTLLQLAAALSLAASATCPVAAWATEAGGKTDIATEMMQLACKGALEMTFPNSQKLKRDMHLASLAMLLQPATGVASIERLPFGAYDFRKTFVFAADGERLNFTADKDQNAYRQYATITLDMITGMLEVTERYEYAADSTKNAQMNGRYQCQRVETAPR